MIKGSTHLALSLLLVACGPATPPDEIRADPDEARRNMMFDTSLPPAELMAEIEQQWTLVKEEMGSVREPIVRVQVEEAYRLEIVSSPGGLTRDSNNTYMVVARLLDDGVLIRVHVPDDVSVSAGDLLEVVAGEYGYYFDTVIDSE